MKHLHIQMFGKFSLKAGSVQISSGDNRSRKLWLLLAYILCHRERIIPRKELINLLWGDESSNNPENALKTTFHRVRSTLDQLWPSAGHELITWKDGGYSWNSKAPITLDIDEFDKLCRKDGKTDEHSLRDSLNALSLYQGDFLGDLASETWIIPIATYYHNLYIQTVLDMIPLLFARERYQEAADICRSAITVEPYHEPLHQHLMQALLELGDLKGVAAVYEELSQQLFDEFGIRPTEETRLIYRTAVSSISSQSLPIDTVLEYLQEKDEVKGALQCDFDYFKILCYAEARAMIRSGKSTHIAILSVVQNSNKEPSKQSMEKFMENLAEQICLNLRRGDTFSRCSVSQYIIMLPQANYENSCMVCRRVLSAFTHRYPHAPAKINFVVQPLSTENFGT